MTEQMVATFQSLKLMWSELLLFFPNLLIAVLLLVVGVLLARFVRFLLLHFLRLIRFNALSERAGIEDFLMKGGVHLSSNVILANVFYWCFLLALTLAILNSLGIQAARQLFNQMLAYLPNLVLAVLVLIFGALAAKFVRGVTYTYLTSLKISGADFFSILVQWALIILVLSLSLTQLSLGSQLFVAAFEIAFGAVCLALAIAFGLAGKEWATQILERLWRQSR